MKRTLSLLLAALLALCALPALAQGEENPVKLTVLTTVTDNLDENYAMNRIRVCFKNSLRLHSGPFSAISALLFLDLAPLNLRKSALN